MRRSHKRNPSLVIYNPPVGVRRSARGRKVIGMIASSVEEIKYFDEEKLAIEGHGYWEHEFEGTDVRAFAVEQPDGQRDILLTSASGKPLWFEEE